MIDIEIYNTNITEFITPIDQFDCVWVCLNYFYAKDKDQWNFKCPWKKSYNQKMPNKKVNYETRRVIQLHAIVR